MPMLLEEILQEKLDIIKYSNNLHSVHFIRILLKVLKRSCLIKNFQDGRAKLIKKSMGMMPAISGTEGEKAVILSRTKSTHLKRISMWTLSRNSNRTRGESHVTSYLVSILTQIIVIRIR